MWMYPLIVLRNRGWLVNIACGQLGTFINILSDLHFCGDGIEHNYSRSSPVNTGKTYVEEKHCELCPKTNHKKSGSPKCSTRPKMTRKKSENKEIVSPFLKNSHEHDHNYLLKHSVDLHGCRVGGCRGECLSCSKPTCGQNIDEGCGQGVITIWYPL